MFEYVRIGDYVRVTGKNGDEVQGKVAHLGTIRDPLELTVFDETVYVLPEEVDSFVIVRPCYEPGLYATSTLPRSILHYDGERWAQIAFHSGVVNHDFEPDLFGDLKKIELPEYMEL